MAKKNISKKGRFSRPERKSQILQILRDAGDRGASPLTATQIAQRANMAVSSHLNSILEEMCDDNLVGVDVQPYRGAVAVRFLYYV